MSVTCIVVLKQDFWWIERQNSSSWVLSASWCIHKSFLPSRHHVCKNHPAVYTDSDHDLACSDRIFKFSSSMETEDCAIPWIAFLSLAQNNGPGFICCKYPR